MNKSLAHIVACFMLVVVAVSCAAQTSETYKWDNVAMGGGGFVSGIITSKTQAGLVYARTDVGGAYRWDAAASKWIPLMDWASENEQGMFGVESMAIDPQQPNVVYASVGISYFNNGKSYILRSADYGANFSITEVTSQFKIHGNGMGRQNGEKLQVDPNNSTVIYCGTRWNGLFKSTDAGVSWSRLSALNVTTTANENGVSFMVLDKSSVSGGVTKRLFAGISRSGNDQNLYKSEDGGATFTALINASLPANLMPQRAVLSGDGNLYISYGNGAGPFGTTAEPYDQGQLWKYNIAGNIWTNVTPSGITRPLSGISVDPGNASRLVASTTNTYSLQKGNVYGDKFFITTNGGSTWTDVVTRGFDMDPNGMPWITGQSIHWAGSIEFDPFNTKKVWVTSGNGVFVNEDIDASTGVWKFTVKGMEEVVPRNMVSIAGGPLVSVISDYDGFTQSDPTQYAPNRHSPAMGSTTGLDYAVTNKKVVRVASSMYYSTDMGLTWTKTASVSGSDGNVAVSADGNIILHCPSGSSVVYRSVNNGSSWAASAGLSFANARPVADGLNSAKFYVYNTGTGSLMVSTDGGASFLSAGNAPGTGGSKIIRTVPGREGHIWIPLLNNGLAYTEDSGATAFIKTGAVTYCSAVGIGKAAPGSSYETIYIWGTVAGISGLQRSTDKGQTWVRVNDDAHEYGGLANGQFVIGDMNVYGRVYMSTAGRGIAYGETGTKNIFPLAVTNFRVSASNETCTTSNDGKIKVTAVQTLNYKATVSRNGTSTEYPFTGTLEITSLTAGTYSLCIMVEGQSDFKQCYELVITEPQPLSVYAYVNNEAKNLFLNLSGAPVYHIELNGKTITTSSNSITLELADGKNELLVTTDKDCQGLIKKSFVIENRKLAYPNPFENSIYVNMGNDHSVLAKVSVFTLSGNPVYMNDHRSENGILQVDLTALKSAVYILKIKTGQGESSSRILKK